MGILARTSLQHFIATAPDRKEHLKGYSGTLQADGYAGYNALYKVNKLSGEIKIIEAACWAHACQA